MKTSSELREVLNRIDGRGYKAYRDIKGRYGFDGYDVIIDHVQGDPFAAPSSMRVTVDQRTAGFPDETYSTKSRETALRDYLTRRFSDATRRFSKGPRGTGKGGLILIDTPGQEILDRSSAFINESGVEIRFRMGLPGFGRRVAGRHAVSMFFEELPRIVKSSLYYRSLDPQPLFTHITTAEDADTLRDMLDSLGLIAFVADGSVLPRASGIDPGPLKTGHIVPFKSPPSLRVEADLPNRGKTSGMGIPRGVTLIVGGGYHGKSTLLKAIELGIYNHVPGDGREYVISDPLTVKIRAEDGRRIERVDISPFISNLPFGKDTRAFQTEDASGSTSQAANIMEMLEAGARVLVMDEDTSATNFMIRDRRMQELVSKEREPITPFIDKVRQLYEGHGVSTLLALGGSGDYFEVADRVICLVQYEPFNMTDAARAVARKHSGERKSEGGDYFGEVTERVPLAGSFDPSRGKREVRISARGLRSIDFGTHRIDLGAVEQLVDTSQTRAVGDAIFYATRYMDGKRSMRAVMDSVMEDIDERGFDLLSSRPEPDYAYFRGPELAAAINRLRTLHVREGRV